MQDPLKGVGPITVFSVGLEPKMSLSRRPPDRGDCERQRVLGLLPRPTHTIRPHLTVCVTSWTATVCTRLGTSNRVHSGEFRSPRSSRLRRQAVCAALMVTNKLLPPRCSVHVANFQIKFFMFNFLFYVGLEVQDAV